MPWRQAQPVLGWRCGGGRGWLGGSNGREGWRGGVQGSGLTEGSQSNAFGRNQHCSPSSLSTGREPKHLRHHMWRTNRKGKAVAEPACGAVNMSRGGGTLPLSHACSHGVGGERGGGSYPASWQWRAQANLPGPARKKRGRASARCAAGLHGRTQSAVRPVLPSIVEQNREREQLKKHI